MATRTYDQHFRTFGRIDQRRRGAAEHYATVHSYRRTVREGLRDRLV